MRLQGLDVAVPEAPVFSAGAGLLRAQEPPGVMPNLAAPPHVHPGSNPALAQGAGVAVLVCLALISAAVLFLTESARWHQHAGARLHPAQASRQPHPRRHRYGLLAAALAALLLAALVLYPRMAHGAW